MRTARIRIIRAISGRTEGDLRTSDRSGPVPGGTIATSKVIGEDNEWGFTHRTVRGARLILGRQQ
ncbi:hypothetical protein GCM10009735_32730 [Actinomadura chokoriensis]